MSKTNQNLDMIEIEPAKPGSLERAGSASTQQGAYNRLRAAGWWPNPTVLVLERNGEYAIVCAGGTVVVVR